MTLRATVGLALACVLVGGIAGYCYQGKTVDAAYQRLDSAYVAYQRQQPKVDSVDRWRVDTVRIVGHAIAGDSLKVDSLTRIIAGKDSAFAAHLREDSASTGEFTAFAQAVQERDSTERTQIASLKFVVAQQDTDAVALRGRLVQANALLAQAIGVSRQLASRADRRWHLVAFAGYGATAAAGTLHAGPQVGVGIGYTLW